MANLAEHSQILQAEAGPLIKATKEVYAKAISERRDIVDSIELTQAITAQIMKDDPDTVKRYKERLSSHKNAPT